CYDNGEGVRQDKAKAVYWYEKAAQQGDAKAQYNLGVCYYNGEGVTRNRTKAKEWFQKAADQGVEQAKAILRKYF
ncbi:MAG: sel1 repeat family protein, partial [Clostridiales bacterium]|nr:sel1 repeat family protein [Clostridiales bacterium]